MAEPARLLVVDDDESVSITMQAVLEMEGYAVCTAPSAARARELIAAQLFDAALLDLRIDDEDGIELLGELRQYQPDCSAIMLTGYASLESAVRAIRQGAYDYLIKPCDLEELKLTIARGIERSQLRRALAERLQQLEEANNAIAAFNSELQQRIASATAELTQTVAELSEAKQQLEEAQRRRFEFISMIAHELSQPLTAVMSYAERLTRSNLPPEKREQLAQTLLRESRRLARLIRDLGDVARLTTGRFRVDPSETNLSELALAQVQLAQETTSSHPIRYEGPSYAVLALCDRDRIAQVLSNLLSNAIKYTAEGTVTLSLDVSDGKAELSVTDEGLGIPEDRLEAIFEPHVRLVPTESGTQPRGAGLGLYIARGIVEAHGGRMWAENRPEGGARVALTLSALVTQHVPAAVE